MSPLRLASHHGFLLPGDGGLLTSLQSRRRRMRSCSHIAYDRCRHACKREVVTSSSPSRMSHYRVAILPQSWISAAPLAWASWLSSSLWPLLILLVVPVRRSADSSARSFRPSHVGYGNCQRCKQCRGYERYFPSCCVWEVCRGKSHDQGYGDDMGCDDNDAVNCWLARRNRRFASKQ